MRTGICILPDLPWAEARPRWQAAEAMGFDHAWTYDHLVWAGMPKAPWHSTVATLSAVAVVTERIRLGTFVASPNFRHPALLAKDVTTLDDVSGGRVLLGLGTGGDLDSTLLGEELSRGQRTRRFEEFVPLVDRMLVEERVSHRGEFFTVEGANCRPACVQTPRVPFVVAANGPRAMRLAAEHGAAWLTTGAPVDEDLQGSAKLEAWWDGVAGLVARMDEVEAEVPVPAGVRRGLGEAAGERLDRVLSLDGPALALASLDLAQEQVGRAAELGFTDVVLHWPRPEEPYRGDEAVLVAYAATM